MRTKNNESQKYLAEIQGLENFADRKKVVTEWLHNDEESYDTLADFFERLFVREDGKTQAILAYFRELNGVEDEYINAGAEDLPEPPAGITGATEVTGERATVIGQQTVGLSSEFVRELLAAKDRQIETLLALVGQLKDEAAK